MNETTLPSWAHPVDVADDEYTAMMDASFTGEERVLWDAWVARATPLWGSLAHRRVAAAVGMAGGRRRWKAMVGWALDADEGRARRAADGPGEPVPFRVGPAPFGVWGAR
jgi:hypothetical protein